MKENKPELSIIIPFAGEYPQVLFTIQSIAESLKGKLDFEIIAVNNMCEELLDQWTVARLRASESLNKMKSETEHGMVMPDDLQAIQPMLNCMAGGDKSGEAIKASANAGNPWLKYMEYKERLSHWECKRRACLEARADTFLFIDAHCVPSTNIAEMWSDYNSGFNSIGSFHMPLTYKILEHHRLIYKMRVENNFYGYTFTGMQESKEPFEVPVMSCCGVMISREIMDRIGGWPCDFGAYGGGENFLNYAMAVTGHLKFIYPNVTLHHHGERRDYHFTYDGTTWNRLVAHYLFGGYSKLMELKEVTKGRPEVLDEWVADILGHPEYKKQRALIKENTIIDLDEWVAQWREKG